MPPKDLTSNSGSSFSADRKAYENIMAIAKLRANTHIQKKWIGGTRDASDVAARRRVVAAGSSLNPTGGDFSFTSKQEKNTRIDALNRCRNKGNCVPPKVAYSPHFTNRPAAFWPSAPLIRTENQAALPLYYLGKSINTIHYFTPDVVNP